MQEAMTELLAEFGCDAAEGKVMDAAELREQADTVAEQQAEVLKEKNKDIRAAAYLRLSIEDGDKAESNSIGNQRELIRDFAAERPGLHLVEEYADDGYTGTNFAGVR